MICNNCKNKDVCKWVDLTNNIIEYYEKTDKSAPLNIEIKCIKRRVVNA